MDISVKLGKMIIDGKSQPYIKVSATCFSADEVAQAINTLVANSDATFDQEITFGTLAGNPPEEQDE